MYIPISPQHRSTNQEKQSKNPVSSQPLKCMIIINRILAINMISLGIALTINQMLSLVGKTSINHPPVITTDI